jgi:hypothetical protein
MSTINIISYVRQKSPLICHYYYYYYLTCPHKERGKEIRTNDLRFKRHDPQPIELPFRDVDMSLLKSTRMPALMSISILVLDLFISSFKSINVDYKYYQLCVTKVTVDMSLLLLLFDMSTQGKEDERFKLITPAS